jgi:UDP:flavonoid glycosyltransferase YjiC (YdhE family)
LATIIFTPYPEMGHLNASLKIAKALRSRGHRVSYLGLPDFEEYVRSQGLGFVTIFEKLCPKGFLHQQAIENRVENFAALLARAKASPNMFDPASEVQEIIRRVQPDLCVIDLLLPDLAKILDQIGTPMVLLNTQLFNPWVEQKALYASLYKLPELILCPEEFEFSRVQRKKNSYYVEPSIDLARRDIGFPWNKLNDNKPLIYCSFGSQSHLIDQSRNFFQRVIDAVALRPDWQLVLGTGAHLNVEQFHSVPPNALLVNFVPQLEVLQRASIMITHGGFNSIKECIFFGVPMLVFPVIRDHPAIAARVVYHGLGLRSNLQNASVEQILSLINRIDRDPTFKTRVELMGREFRRIEESESASQIIQTILDELKNNGCSD